MNTIDPKMAQRVWQRVTAGDPQPDLKQLAFMSRENRLLYQLLAEVLAGRHAEQAKQMAQQERHTEAVLLGIGLMQGERFRIAAPKPAKEPAERLLAKCCRKTLHTARQYALRGADSEFGSVFMQLSRRQQEHAESLLAMLGEQAEKGVRP